MNQPGPESDDSKNVDSQDDDSQDDDDDQSMIPLAQQSIPDLSWPVDMFKTMRPLASDRVDQDWFEALVEWLATVQGLAVCPAHQFGCQMETFNPKRKWKMTSIRWAMFVLGHESETVRIYWLDDEGDVVQDRGVEFSGYYSCNIARAKHQQGEAHDRIQRYLNKHRVALAEQVLTGLSLLPPPIIRIVLESLRESYYW